MAVFSYKARDHSGKLVSGQLEGRDKAFVANKIGEMGFIPVEIQSVSEQGAPPLMVWLSRRMHQARNTVSLKELVYFSRQLGTLYGAGVPIQNSLSLLGEQTTNPYFQQIIREIVEQIKEGKNLSVAMAKFPKVFDELYVSLIESGESSGNLEFVFERLANLLDFEIKIRADIKSATRYPKIVVMAMVGAFVLAVTFIVPKFMGIFQASKMELPLPSKILMNLSIYFRAYWYWLALLVGGIWIGFKVLLKTPKGLFWWDRIKLRFPVFGQLFMKIYMSRFVRTFVNLYNSGLPVILNLDISAKTFGNTYLTSKVVEVKEGVKEGADMWERMRRSQVFPPLVYHMFAIGESSGALDRVLGKVSDYYDREVDYGVKNLTSMLEPIMIIGMGAMVLFLALGIFLPMWDLTKLAQKK
jgi:MSHA biogenesis protein MshG